MKILDNQNRSKLAEGRNIGFGFAFLNDKLETVQPFSPCKDYLNEVVYSEKVNKKSSAYGLTYEPQSIFKNNIRLAFKVLNNSNSTNDLNETLRSKLNIDYKSIQKLLNRLENHFNIPLSTIHKANDDIYVLELDKWWVEDTWRISAYSMLVRNALGYKRFSIYNHLFGKNKTNIENRDITYLKSFYYNFPKLVSTNYISPCFTNFKIPHIYGIYYAGTIINRGMKYTTKDLKRSF